jgi:cell division protein FtsL
LTLVFVAVLTSLGIYQVWQRYEVYSLGLSLSTETLQYSSLLDESRKLKLELATIKRAGRIRREAANRLGMHVPPPQDIVEIR